MKMDELIDSINHCVDEFDYVAARKYIEENMEVIEKNKHSLKSNAREIYKFIAEQVKSGIQPLSRAELNIINSINAYAYKFDLRGIKSMIKNNAQIFMRKEAVAYLNSDAKTILSGMNVIND